MNSRTEITYTVGDATQPAGRGPSVIAHVCNDLGGWGRGFVLAISSRWKEPERAYRAWASGTGPRFALGEVQFVGVGPQLWVANMVAQNGVHAKNRVPPIRYDALRFSLVRVASFCTEHRASVHMPRIGCGLAGGEWSVVSTIVDEELTGRGIDVTVYDLPPQNT